MGYQLVPSGKKVLENISSACHTQLYILNMNIRGQEINNMNISDMGSIIPMFYIGYSGGSVAEEAMRKYIIYVL